VKLYLNSNFYPYDDLNLDFDKKRYAILFDMYARFKAYYRMNYFETLFNVLSFITIETLDAIYEDIDSLNNLDLLILCEYYV